MPEKTEELVESHEDSQTSVHESNQKTSNKYKKIFKLFRSMRKESPSNKIFDKEVEKNAKKVKKKKWDTEERKEIFKKNMENSWVELPNTLQRKKEKISEEILSEFHDPDSSDSDGLSQTKKTKEKEIFKTNRSYAPNEGNDDGEPTCEYFRKKEEDEIEAESVKSKETELTKQEKVINYKKKKNFHSEIICQRETVSDEGEVSLEKIRKLVEADYESRRDDGGSDDNADDETSTDNNKKSNSYDSKAAVEEINLLFHDLITENGDKTLCEVTDSSTAFDESDYDVSDPYVSLVGSSAQQKKRSQVDKIDNLRRDYQEERKEIKMSFTRSESSDSLLNGSSPSVSSSSDLSQREVSNEKMGKEVTSDFHSENESNCYEQNVEVTYVNEINEARPNLKDLSSLNETKSSCVEAAGLASESIENQSKAEPQVFFKRNVKETTQYSDIIFSLPANTQGIFVNEYFNEELSSESSEQEKPKNSDSKDKIIIYQELDFVKSPRDDKKSKEETKTEEGFQSSNKKIASESEEKIEKVKEIKETRNSISSTVTNSLSEEQKAKKKSAEAIAKELSSQILSKRNQGNENLEGKRIFTNVVSISVSNDFKTESTAESTESQEPFVNESDSSKPEMEGTRKVIETEDTSKVIRTPDSNGSSDNWDKKGLMVSELPYFSVADWRKAVVMGTKRGMNLSAMETIVEEPESDTSTKLTVREILRRFEELGNKHFSESSCMTDDERTATLKQIYQTLKCLEEKVKNFENWDEINQKQQQYAESPRIKDHSSGAWTGRGAPQKLPHSTPVRGNHHENEEEVSQTSINDGKHSLLQFAIHHFRQSPEKFEMLKTSDGSISGSLKVIESKNKKNKGKSVGKDSSEWTWKEQVDLVKFTAKPIEQSLLQLDTPELSDLAVECFICLMRYMGDLPMPTDVSEVKCVYTILMHCHKFEQLRDEVYCQLMKQTTNNKSIQQESCQRGWRLFSIVAAYFVSSDTLKPFLFKYLETAAYDKRRAYHGTAMVCLQNLRKTFKYGGRKNVPSVEEITAISAGRNSKRQIYRLPGGTEKVVNTRSTTVVQDVIEELCVMINVTNPQEMEEFSVYCIVEGDTFTMPLAREEYILDVTTELHKNHQVFYLIFCRSVWYFPLRLDSQLYVEVVFNQIAPDYLEGLLLIMPGESLEQDVIYDISKIAALLHRAADMTHVPSMKETKFLLPKPALSVRDVKPSQWVNMVQSNWQDCENLTTIQAKAQVLDVLSKWPLFGSSFFAVKKASEPKERTDNILALNRNGVHFIDLITHETLLHYPFSEVISTRKVKSEDGTLFLDMKCGNLMQQRITRLQTDQAHEISRLIRQYITMQQRMGANLA